MAKTKTSKQKTKTKEHAKEMANGNGRPKETPEQLYAAALDLVEQSQPDEALKKAQQLLDQVRDGGNSKALPALNLLGEISMELGDADSARKYFEHAVALDPDGKITETMGGGAEKFLWLAQLSDEGGKESVAWFEKGASALQHEIAALEQGGVSGFDEEQLLLMRLEKKRKLANTLCAIVEVYMTDLSWEDDAEMRCESLITEAVAVEDDTSAEVLQTLASVRLSQERKEDAQAALKRSIDIWAELAPEDPAVPDFATKISLSRLLMEAELESDAMVVLNRLVQEDDQSVEAWYLGGWCQHLIATHEEAASAEVEHSNHADRDDGQDANVTLKGSRHWLTTSIKLYGLLDYEDERLFAHANELVATLDTVLGPEDEQAEAEGGEELYEDEWDGIDDEDEVDEEMQDV